MLQVRIRIRQGRNALTRDLEYDMSGQHSALRPEVRSQSGSCRGARTLNVRHRIGAMASVYL